jgi:hypothetical protein
MQAVRKLKLNELYRVTRFFCQVDLDIANLLSLGRGRAACPNQNGNDPGPEAV